jgi:hypothetical protein
VEYRSALCDTADLQFSIEVDWNFYSMFIIGISAVNLVPKNQSSSPGLVENCKLTLFISLSYVYYLFQVWIVGEKVGEGIGRTRKEAQCQAAEISLRNLASKFVFPA